MVVRNELKESIEECPVLSDEEKKLLIRIDVQGESISKVAKSVGVAKSTMSVKHQKILRKLDKYLEWSADQAFEKLVFSELNSGRGPN